MDNIKVKVCSYCKTVKAWSDFHMRSDRLAPKSQCKECSSMQSPERAAELEAKRLREREWRKTRPDLYRERDLKRHHGINLAQYNSMLEAQDNKCAICKIDQSLQARHMAVDHNHSTQKIRALLCSNCNTLIGLSKENIEILSKTIEYLKLHVNEKGELAKL